MDDITPLGALGDPTRRRLLERLRRGPCSVNRLAAELPMSQPAVSQHLRVLREARLVRVEKRGQMRIYHLDPAGLVEIRRFVESLWDDVLQAFGDEAAGAAANLVQEEPDE